MSWNNSSSLEELFVGARERLFLVFSRCFLLFVATICSYFLLCSNQFVQCAPTNSQWVVTRWLFIVYVHRNAEVLVGTYTIKNSWICKPTNPREKGIDAALASRGERCGCSLDINNSNGFVKGDDSYENG